MKIKFYLDEFDYVNVDADGKGYLIGSLLTDVNHSKTIDDILNEYEKVFSGGGDWDISTNKSYITITREYVRCGDLFNEDNYIDIKPKAFKALMFSWRKFVNYPTPESWQRISEADIL